MLLHNILLLTALALPLSENTAAINGSVVDQDNKPIIDTRIILLQSDSFSTVATARTDENGSFSLSEIEPGEYMLLAWYYEHTSWLRILDLKNKQTITLDIKLDRASDEEFLIKQMKPRQEDLDYYAPALEAFKEPHFCSDNAIKENAESYRFLWLRSFDHPVLFNLEYSGPGKAKVTYKELNGYWGDYGSLAEEKELDVYEEMIRKYKNEDIKYDQTATQAYLETILEHAQKQVWEQPYKYEIITGISGIMITLDGAYWTIEAIKDGKCHVVTRHSPERNEPVRRFAETLIQLSGKRFYYDEVY
jgi:hypothetical protein